MKDSQPLTPAYYVDDFMQVVGDVRTRYGFLLNGAEEAYMAKLDALSDPHSVSISASSTVAGPAFALTGSTTRKLARSARQSRSSGRPNFWHPTMVLMTNFRSRTVSTASHTPKSERRCATMLPETQRESRACWHGWNHGAAIVPGWRLC